MLRVSFRRIKPDKEVQLRAWLAALSTRADEVRATFVDETVRQEQAFILQTAEGPVLVCAMEAEDFKRGRAAFNQSNHPIDEEHKSIMAECLGDDLGLQPLYDVALKVTSG